MIDPTQLHRVEALLEHIEAVPLAEMPIVIDKLETVIQDPDTTPANRTAAKLVLSGTRTIMAHGNWRDAELSFARERVAA
jgi:hypothetical protein